MSEFQLFARRIGLISITNLISGLSALLLVPILTKTIPIEEYGVWVQITITLVLVPIIVMLGLPYTMVRFLAAVKEREKIQEAFYSIFTIILVTTGLTSIVIYLFSGLIATYFFDNQIQIVKILSFIVFFECLNLLLLNYFRTFQQIKKYTIFSCFQTCIKVASVAIFVFLGYGIFGAVIGLLITDIFHFVLMFLCVISEIGVTLPRFIDIREYLAFGLPTVQGNLSAWIVDSSDRFIIGFCLGSAFVGYYAPGCVLGSMVTLFVAPLIFLLPSALSKYYDEANIENVKLILKHTVKYFLALSIPSIVGLSLLSKPILMILSTPSIAEKSYIITPFFACCGLLFGLHAIIVNILVLEKKTNIMALIWVFAAVLSLGLNFLLVPRIGILGAAITMLFTYFFAFVLTMFFSSKYFVFPIDFYFLLKCIFASLIMALVIILVERLIPVTLIYICLIICISSLTYCVALLILKGFKRHEIDFFINIFC